MNIDINLLPEELRPKPLINTRMLALLVVIVALGYGCYYFYGLKSDSQAEAATVESRIEATQNEASTMSSNPVANEIMAEITEAEATKTRLEAATNDYEDLVGSRIEWGDVVDRVSGRVPSGVTITSIAESGDTGVEVAGTASSYERVAAYASSLQGDEAFDNVHTSSWSVETGEFQLTLDIVSGGAR